MLADRATLDGATMFPAVSWGGGGSGNKALENPLRVPSDVTEFDRCHERVLPLGLLAFDFLHLLYPCNQVR
jgi:hypothetical protein